MPQPYGIDLSQRIVDAIEQDGLTLPEAQAKFGVSRTCIRAMRQRFRLTGCPASSWGSSGSRAKLNLGAKNKIAEWLQENNTLSLSDIAQKMNTQGIFVNRATISRTLKRMGWNNKRGRWSPSNPRGIADCESPTNEDLYKNPSRADRIASSTKPREQIETENLRSEYFLSPLRYPGGKRRLVPYVQELLIRNGLRPSLFIEPFAGGAAVSIGVLALDLVDQIALADRDELISDFWATVFSKDASWLANQCHTLELNLKTWRQMRAMKPRNRRERALKCLYLNRTSFSGILEPHAGPLGGYTQSKTLIDCRFPREELARRIITLAEKRDRVLFIRAQTYGNTFKEVRRLALTRTQPDKLFWYLDPPFFQKADRLYTHCFDITDHQALAKRLEHLPGNWLLSYDDHPNARLLYGHRQELQYAEVIYSSRRSDHVTAGRKLYAGREILISNLDIPGVQLASKRSHRIRLAVLDGASSKKAAESENDLSKSTVAVSSLASQAHDSLNVSTR